MRVLYFAWLRERAGRSAEDIPLADDIADVAALIRHLSARNQGLADAFANPALIRCAVNQVFAKPETTLKQDDEVAFFPPVTGG